MSCRSVLLALAVAATAATAVAQGGEAAAPTAQVGRVDEAAAPRIDGDLGESCWTTAPAIGDLVMVEPWAGRAPTQRTVVKLLHDRHHLYLALWCFDDQPGEIRASMRARDARLDPDDRVEILLDPFENRRTAYFFQIGAGGSIGDILISNDGGRFDKPWDAVWSGAAKVVADGWHAEIAIPFRSLPRRDGARSWGFNLRRYVRTRHEEYQWANPSQSVSFYRASQCGTIEGFGPIDGGLGVEVVPFTTFSWRRDRTAADPGFAFDPDAGGDAYLRLSPSLTLALTALTDFAETEDDERQINLNRFPLFFPEKRDFFLEGTGYFGFGATRAGGTQVQPFFSRRIGLARDGTKVPLLGGAKLTGQIGPLEIGVLDVQTDTTGALESENLAVGRAKYAFADGTTVGVFGSSGEPTSTGENHVGGVDFWHREPRFLGDMDLRATVDALWSDGVAGTGGSYGGLLESSGREWQWEAGLRQVDADFDPALGFVRRRDTRTGRAYLGYRPRLGEGGAIRNLAFALGAQRAEAVDGSAQDLSFAIERIGVELHSADTAYAYLRRAFERVEDEFTLFRDSTPVLAGDYWTTRGGLQFVTSEGRPWNASVRLESGSFFDGRAEEVEVESLWRVSPLVHLGADYQTTWVDLGPDRDFQTQIVAGRVDLHFSPSVSLRNLAQFDNESEVLGWQSRLRWIYRPGCDFFAVLGTAWQREADGSMLPTTQDLQFKVSHSLRF